MRRSADLTAGGALSGLKLRTLAIALVMAALLGAGLWLCLSAVAPLLAAMAGAQGIHLPTAPAADQLRLHLVQALMGLLFVLALLGFSTARFGRLSPAWLLALAGVVLAWSHWIGMPLVPLAAQAVPGEVERAAARQTLDHVDQLMRQRGHGEATRNYVLAQMALRDGQREPLLKHGSGVLDAVDRVTYGPLQDARVSEALRFDPAVVARLDRAMHGQPLSEPGLGLAAGATTPAPGRAGPLARLLLGVVALAAGLVLLRLWLTMQRRVVDLALDAGQPDPAEVAATAAGAPPQGPASRA